MSSPATLSFSPGNEVLYEDRRSVVLDVVDMESIRIRDIVTGQDRTVAVFEVLPVSFDGDQPPRLEAVSKDGLKIAQKRFEVIKPLVGGQSRTRAEVELRALEFGYHVNTVYDWIRLYEESQLLTSLAPRKRSDKGSRKLSAAVEGIVSEVIESDYLNKQKKSAAKVIQEVKRRCIEAGLKAPHPNTIRKRIQSLPVFKTTARRHGLKQAKEKHTAIQGAFPGADWPLAVVQMDHTQLDIILVDDIHRHSIGRPWITLAMDVFSRMVLGFHVSFDPPGAASTGLCLAHAILPKDTWLAEKGIKGDWPCWGLPKTVHVDNAKEFRGTMLRRACQQYGIDIEWRPVGRPQFGGHVERLLGTLGKEIHSLPGATFSSPAERGDYDSDQQAAFTFSEFETWLCTFIVNVYHQQVHSALHVSPLEKFKEGVLGTEERPGIGLPPRIVDEDRIRLDFMPFVERTIQAYGVAIDNVQYWHDVLRPWIGAMDKAGAKVKRKFLFRRNPRDISTIWFFDPELHSYFPIPYRDTSHPPISVWELREAIRRVKDEGRGGLDEETIFEAYGRMRELEESARANTKAARRAGQRRRMGIGAPQDKKGEHEADQTMSSFGEIQDDPIQPFEEMDDLS